MRAIRWGTLLALPLVVGLTQEALHADVVIEIANGDSVTGTIRPASEEEVFAIQVPAGAAVSASAKGLKQANGATLPARLQLLDAEGRDLAADTVKTNQKGAKFKKLVVPATGEYRLVVTGEGLTSGEYQLNVKWKSPKQVKDALELDDDEQEFPFSADRGAFLTVTAKAAKRSPAAPHLLRIEGPNGFRFDGFGEPTTGTKHVAKNVLLTESGSYSLFLVSDTETDGDVSVKLKVKPPRPTKRKLSVTSLDIGADLDGDDLARGRIVTVSGGEVRLGGEVPVELSGSGVDVPADALPTATPILVGSAPPITSLPEPNLQEAGSAVFFGPPGLRFAVPATVRLRFDPTGFQGDFSGLRVVRREGNGSVDVVPPGDVSVDGAAGVVSFPVSGFTTFQVFGPPPPAPIDPSASDTLTANAVARLIRGDDDFDAISADLAEARRLDFTNQAAAVFLAFSDLLDFTQSEGFGAGGDLRSLAERSGLTPVTAPNFWDQTVVQELHGQGEIKDTAPNSSEFATYARSELRMALVDFLTTTANVNTDFEYRISNLDARDRFFDGSAADDTESVWVDFGDVQYFRAVVHLALAAVEFVDAYDAAAFSPNTLDRTEFPARDRVGFLADTFPDLGTLARPSKLIDARAQLQQALLAWERGSTYLFDESPDQRANGFLTPFRNAFRGQDDRVPNAARDRAIGADLGQRQFAEHVLDRMLLVGDRDLELAQGGVGVPITRRHRLNLERVFSVGLDPRDLLDDLTYQNPFTGRRDVGVEDLADIDGDLLTADGFVTRLFGEVPVAGDIQGVGTDLVGLRIDSPPTSTHTVDGSFADWDFGTDSVQLVTPPSAGLDEDAPSPGELWMSRDATHLYFASTAPVADQLTFDLKLTQPGAPRARASKYTILEFVDGDRTPREEDIVGPKRLLIGRGRFIDDQVVRASIAEGSDGTEIAVPLALLPNGTHVEIEFHVGFAVDPDSVEQDLREFFLRPRPGFDGQLYRPFVSGTGGRYPDRHTFRRGDIFVRIR